MEYLAAIILFLLLTYLICDNIEKSKKIKSIRKIFKIDYDHLETYEKFHEIEKIINNKL